jgi:hypothetical protein
MERPTPQPGNPTPEGTPYHLSRDYEDRLDWLENQRRDRTKRNRGTRVPGTRVLFGFTSLFMTAFAFAGAFLRRRT